MQGYNCQAFTSADGIILATEAGTSPVDCEYFPSMVEKATAAAQLVTNLHNRGVSPGDGGASRIGIMLADAGYCTLQNLTLPGPDRLIATGKSRDLQAAANDNPAAGIAPATAGPVEAMAHRLRTPDGIATYRKRSHIAETTFGHAKHNLGFRRFIGRGLARARSEWALHATIHNIGKILTRLAGNPLPAPA